MATTKMNKLSIVGLIFLGFATIAVTAKVLIPYTDVWRYPNVSLSLQPKNTRDAASLVKTIARQIECDLEEAGFWVPGRGFADSLCYKKIETEKIVGKLNLTIEAFFTKEQLEKELSSLSEYYPFILVGDYYIIAATYWDNRYDTMTPAPNVAPSIEDETLLEGIPREYVYYSEKYKVRELHSK